MTLLDRLEKGFSATCPCPCDEVGRNHPHLWRATWNAQHMVSPVLRPMNTRDLLHHTDPRLYRQFSQCRTSKKMTTRYRWTRCCELQGIGTKFCGWGSSWFLANYFANSLESGATVRIYPSLFDLAYCDENPIQHSEHWVMIHCD